MDIRAEPTTSGWELPQAVPRVTAATAVTGRTQRRRERGGIRIGKQALSGHGSQAGAAARIRGDRGDLLKVCTLIIGCASIHTHTRINVDGMPIPGPHRKIRSYRPPSGQDPGPAGADSEAR
ncbi:hypothetical protein [Streptomyces sp. NBC_00335]|uniref:hypothetical protein n=1 Tax=Streptomyces sp. NBC_00335 TaxID=2975714 RepID=UPI003FA6A4DF